MRQRGRRHRRRVGALVLVAAALLASACGTRRSIDEIATAAGASSASPGGATGNGGTNGVAAGSGNGTGSGTGAAGGTAGGSGSAGGGGAGGGSATDGATSGGGGAGADAGGGGGATGPTGPATGDPIVIGNVGDYNGIVGAIVGQVPVTLQAWVSYINDRGGINGRPVRVITGNTGSDPAQNAALVRDMVENQHVVAFVSNMDPLSFTGSQSYLEGRGIPLIGGDGVTEAWNQSQYRFPVTTGIRPLISDILDVAVNAGKPKIAWLYCVEGDFICGFANRILQGGGAADRGAELVYSAQVSIAQPSFTAECLQAQRSGAQTIMAFVDAASLNRLSRDCRQQGFQPLYTTGSIGVSTASNGNRDLVGLTAPVTVFPWMADDIAPAREYHEALQQYAPGTEPSSDGAVGWASALAFAEAARRAGAEVTPQTLIAALTSFDGETLGGATVPLTFEAGVPHPPSSCYFTATMAADPVEWSAPDGSRVICP